MISKKDVEKLAGLARIKLTPSEEEKFAKEIDSIVGYVDKIKNFKGNSDVDMSHKSKNVLRDDDNFHQSGAFSEDILNEAPHREGDYIKVKKILGGNDNA